MNDKYVIKNCPAYNDTPNMYDEICGYCDNEHDIDLNKCMCENITDCLLKRIIELCKCEPLIFDGNPEYNDFIILGIAMRNRDILEKFEIQEINNENT